MSIKGTIQSAVDALGNAITDATGEATQRVDTQNEAGESESRRVENQSTLTG